jgi:nucleoside-diphosphate-sugar epimerase
VQKIIALDKKPFSGVKPEKVEFVMGDLNDLALLERLTKDVDMVIHAAAIIDWGTKSPAEVLESNFTGTTNIINAAKKNGVKYLLYTSSLDAVYSGKALVDIIESQAYPSKHANVYCESKHLSELEVQKANNEGLTSCILRPCDIFGEKDPYHIEPLINMAKSGFYVRLGNGSAKCQHVYVGNMAHAHVLAASELWKGNKKIAGEIYFITDGPGHNFFSFYDRIVEGAGYSISPKKMWIPKGLAYAMGTVSEYIAILMRPIKRYNPKFSRFAVSYTCTDFTFSSDKAIKDFAYYPKYDHEQAIQNTIAFYSKKDQ